MSSQELRKKEEEEAGNEFDTKSFHGRSKKYCEGPALSVHCNFLGCFVMGNLRCKRDEAKLDTFLHKCLRRILRIYWPMRVTNEEVRKQALDRACTAHGPPSESAHCFNLGTRG